MSPFPIEAIDEVIWRIDEALGTPNAPRTTLRGWVRKASTKDFQCFLEGLRLRLVNAKFVLTDKEHQEWLRENFVAEAYPVVLKEVKKEKGGAK